MTLVRIVLSTFCIAMVVSLGYLHAQPGKEPVVIDGQLSKFDPRDSILKTPSKKYAFTLTKDKTYIIDLESEDFDPVLRLLNRGKQVAEDDDTGGKLNARIVYTAKETGVHDVVAITLEGRGGRFKLKIREYALKGEKTPREVGAGGLVIADGINLADQTNFGKLARRYSIAVKAGKSYTIDMQSADLDSYLYLFDNHSRLIAQAEADDEDGGDLNARIQFRADSDSVIHVVTTSYEGDDTGRFTLKVRQND